MGKAGSSPTKLCAPCSNNVDGSALKIVSILVLSLNLARMLASLVEALFLVCYQEPILGSCRYTVFTDAKNM